MSPGSRVTAYAPYNDIVSFKGLDQVLYIMFNGIWKIVVPFYQPRRVGLDDGPVTTDYEATIRGAIDRFSPVTTAYFPVGPGPDLIPSLIYL